MSTLAQTVERAILLDAAPERVWDAITEPSLLGEWLAEEVELDPRVGGEIVCRYADGEDRRGEVELVEEAERLSFRWWREEGGASRVKLALEAVGGGTRLTVVETRLGPAAPSLVAAAWTARLGRLPLLLGRLVLA